MAPAFLYNARSYFIDNTKIFRGGRINIQFLPAYKGMTTAEYRYSHRENLVRTHTIACARFWRALKVDFRSE